MNLVALIFSFKLEMSVLKRCLNLLRSSFLEIQKTYPLNFVFEILFVAFLIPPAISSKFRFDLHVLVQYLTQAKVVVSTSIVYKI